MVHIRGTKITALAKWLLLAGVVIVLAAAVALTATADPGALFMHP
jgi:hypothetical protein